VNHEDHIAGCNDGSSVPSIDSDNRISTVGKNIQRRVDESQSVGKVLPQADQGIQVQADARTNSVLTSIGVVQQEDLIDTALDVVAKSRLYYALERG
jgi:hypothetical protein